MVANGLAEKFMQPLLLLSEEKNYSAGISCLAEILDWSREFYDQYYDTIINWEIFRCSSDNIYEAYSLDEFIVAFGGYRIKTLRKKRETQELFYRKIFRSNPDELF